MPNPPDRVVVIALIRPSSVMQTVTARRALRHLARGKPPGPRNGVRGETMAEIANERKAPKKNVFFSFGNLFLFRGSASNFRLFWVPKVLPYVLAANCFAHAP